MYNSIKAPFGDEIYEFRLSLDTIRELERKTDAGPLQLMTRIIDGNWRTDDVRETIRLGLVGAGMKATDALSLVSLYASEGNVGAVTALAVSIIGAALYGTNQDGEAAFDLADTPKSSATAEA